MNLATVQGLTLTDPKLQSELAKALELLSQARDTEAKPVDIHFTGQGQSEVRIGYVSEMPVWRTSYRLDLSEKAHSRAGPSAKTPRITTGTTCG